MNKILPTDIHIITKNSDVHEEVVQRTLRDTLYPNTKDWKKFLQVFLLTLGIGFTIAGIIFFFAYNWASLHKFVKIGLIQILLLVTTLLVFLPKIQLLVRNSILTAAALLVGVLFAVYGQVYQTGANAYDFFLAWTLFITLWVMVSRFALLWLIYLVLINTTFGLYVEQVANDWSTVLNLSILCYINAVVALIVILWNVKNPASNVPRWFLHTVVVGAVFFATLGVGNGIFDSYTLAFPILVVITSVFYGLGLWHGLRSRNLFYLSVLPLSMIIIFSTLFVKISTGELMFLFVSAFIIVSVTLVIKSLIDLQKKWSHEKD
jgi:uncharacterized membrane protein